MRSWESCEDKAAKEYETAAAELDRARAEFGKAYTALDSAWLKVCASYGVFTATQCGVTPQKLESALRHSRYGYTPPPPDPQGTMPPD